MCDLLEQRHPLVVLDPLSLHRSHRFAARSELLAPEHRPGVVEGRFDNRHHVERVGGRLSVEQIKSGQRERRERLVERKIGLQIDREPNVACSALLDDARGPQRLVNAERTTGEGQLPPPRFVVVEHERVHMRECVAAAGDHVDEHGRGHLHARNKHFRFSVDEAPERRLAPRHETLRRPFPDDLALFLGVIPGLLDGPEVLGLVIGRLDDDGACRVVAGPAGTSGNLVKLARIDLAHFGAVELRQRGEKHGSNGHVDTHPERVGAANHAQ